MLVEHFLHFFDEFTEAFDEFDFLAEPLALLEFDAVFEEVLLALFEVAFDAEVLLALFEVAFDAEELLALFEALVWFDFFLLLPNTMFTSCVFQGLTPCDIIIYKIQQKIHLITLFFESFEISYTKRFFFKRIYCYAVCFTVSVVAKLAIGLALYIKFPTRTIGVIFCGFFEKFFCCVGLWCAFFKS